MAEGHWNAITDAELDIMKVLWKTGPSKSSVIFEAMQTNRSRLTGTSKTLLARLVQKGLVKRDTLNSRMHIYSPAITEEEYIEKNRRWMIEKMFNGNAVEMLANLIEEEDIAVEDLHLLLNN